MSQFLHADSLAIVSLLLYVFTCSRKSSDFMLQMAKNAPRRVRSLILENRERLIPLAVFAKSLPQPLTRTAVLLWCRRGRRATLDRDDQRRVKLEYVRQPQGFCTSEEAYWRFLEALNGGES